MTAGQLRAAVDRLMDDRKHQGFGSEASESKIDQVAEIVSRAAQIEAA